MNGRLQYLKEVLGIESWIRPQRASPVTVLLKPAWSLEEKALVEKILVGAGLGGVPVSTEASSSSANVIVFDSTTKPSKAVENGQIFWYLGPLRSLLVGSPGEIQTAKREVWNLLKLLKEEISI